MSCHSQKVFRTPWLAHQSHYRKAVAIVPETPIHFSHIFIVKIHAKSDLKIMMLFGSSCRMLAPEKGLAVFEVAALRKKFRPLIIKENTIAIIGLVVNSDYKISLLIFQVARMIQSPAGLLGHSFCNFSDRIEGNKHITFFHFKRTRLKSNTRFTN